MTEVNRTHSDGNCPRRNSGALTPSAKQPDSRSSDFDSAKLSMPASPNAGSTPQKESSKAKRGQEDLLVRYFAHTLTSAELRLLRESFSHQDSLDEAPDHTLRISQESHPIEANFLGAEAGRLGVSFALIRTLIAVENRLHRLRIVERLSSLSDLAEVSGCSRATTSQLIWRIPAEDLIYRRSILGPWEHDVLTGDANVPSQYDGIGADPQLATEVAIRMLEIRAADSQARTFRTGDNDSYPDARTAA